VGVMEIFVIVFMDLKCHNFDDGVMEVFGMVFMDLI
jgi:hypothetical protein